MKFSRREDNQSICDDGGRKSVCKAKEIYGVEGKEMKKKLFPLVLQDDERSKKHVG